VILLAAGEGSRVRALTRDQAGVSVPKQFCAPDGGRSMLHWAIRRAARLVPTERIVPVVAARHRRWWCNEFSGIPRRNLAIQPCNRGTTFGILFPLLQILEHHDGARVLILPSDHFVGNERVLRGAVIQALDAVVADPARVVLVGMPPRESDTEYGWILPSRCTGRVCRVGAFVEKPDRMTARTLMRRGAILNSFIIAGTGDALKRLYPRSMSHLVRELAAWCDNDATDLTELASLYRGLPWSDFSKDVLQRSCESLSVVRATACGWTDLGTPDRLRHHWRQFAGSRAQATRSEAYPRASAVIRRMSR
jgi:mannose-1-phosphate guanylyltransferase